MPDIKEKLVELIHYCTSCEECFDTDIADHLIANGVTIQKWISVEERLPTKEDADENESVLAVYKPCEGERYWPWEVVARYPKLFRCWMPLPEQPKGE